MAHSVFIALIFPFLALCEQQQALNNYGMLEEIHPTTTTSVDLESGNSDHMLLPPCTTSGGENYPHSRYDNRQQHHQEHLFHPQGAHSTSASAPPAAADVQFHSQMIYSAPHHHSRGMAAFV